VANSGEPFLQPDGAIARGKKGKKERGARAFNGEARRPRGRAEWRGGDVGSGVDRGEVVGRPLPREGDDPDIWAPPVSEVWARGRCRAGVGLVSRARVR
jgi:hypothetical protein